MRNMVKKSSVIMMLILLIGMGLYAQGQKNQPVDSSMSNQSTTKLKVLSFYANFDPNKNPQKELIEERTGYEVEYFMLPQDSEKADEKLNITVASGSDYDILKLRPYQYYRLVEQGALQELDTFLASSGSTLKSVIKPLSWEVAKYKDKTYAIPLSNERPNIANSLAIRKDLLDKAGIPIPKTLEEFTETLRAIKKQYPDLIPMTGPGRIDQQMYLNTFVPVIAGAFGIYNEWTDVDGELVHYVNMPGFKEYLSYMTGLYEEGLIDIDWPVNTLASCNEKFVSGKAVIDPYHYNDAAANLTALKGNFSDAELVYINALKGPRGEGVRIERKINYFICVPKSSKHGEDAIKFMDKMLEYENFEFLTLGIENVHFTKEGTNFEPIMPIFNEERFWSYWYLMGIDEYKYPDMWLARIKKNESMYSNFEQINGNIAEVGHLDVTGFSPTVEAVANNQQSLRKQVDDFCIRALVGTEDLSNYESMVESWKKNGGEAMTSEMNSWYRDFISRNGKITL
ncbi:MAG: extracellular solute-binding protein [Sphaerochaeta sp.]|nr:extracellular solute-binding protein [Sphaerochaeta sp.]